MVWHLGASSFTTRRHSLEPVLSGIDSSGVFDDDEELSLLPPAGEEAPEGARQAGPPTSVMPFTDELQHPPAPPLHPAGSTRPQHTHKHSFSQQMDNAVHAFQVALFKPAPDAALLMQGGLGAGGGGASAGTSSTQEDEPFLQDLRLTMESLRPDTSTSEWLLVGLTLLPKISWVR